LIDVDHTSVGWDRIAGPQHEDVARYQLVSLDRAFHPLAPYPSAYASRSTKRRDRSMPGTFGGSADGGVCAHHGRNQSTLEQTAGHDRDTRRSGQENAWCVHQLPHEKCTEGGLGGLRHAVASKLAASSPDLVQVESADKIDPKTVDHRLRVQRMPVDR
jgi:hypothetical protein